MKLLFISLIFIFLLGCTQNTVECTTAQECPLPQEYAIRSNCPFSTACVDQQCEIVCYDYNGQVISEDSRVTCETDNQCACDHYTAEGSCACVEGYCAYVVE